jgi:hypothetical protein
MLIAGHAEIRGSHAAADGFAEDQGLPGLTDARVAQQARIYFPN